MNTTKGNSRTKESEKVMAIITTFNKIINTTLNKNTAKAVETRIKNGEYQFYIGKYYYEADTLLGVIRRREQEPGRTPTTDWKIVNN